MQLENIRLKAKEWADLINCVFRPMSRQKHRLAKLCLLLVL